MKGINISTTMLVVDGEGQIVKEGNNYLQIERYEPGLHEIYEFISSQTANSLADLTAGKIHEKCFSPYDLNKHIKVSPQKYEIVSLFFMIVDECSKINKLWDKTLLCIFFAEKRDHFGDNKALNRGKFIVIVVQSGNDGIINKEGSH